MFLGEFQHSLDTKGRVILPAKYRDQLADGAFVTKGKGGCLSVFTPEEFEQVATQIREQSKRGPKELNAARVFFGGTSEIQPDKQGRVALPGEPAGVRPPGARGDGRRPLLPDRDLGPRPVARARPDGRRRPSPSPTTCPISGSDTRDGDTLTTVSLRARHQPPGRCGASAPSARFAFADASGGLVAVSGRRRVGTGEPGDG